MSAFKFTVFLNIIHPCSPKFNEIFKKMYIVLENKISGSTWHFTLARFLKIDKYISCFMSSLEKPYVVDNSALTGREAASASHIPWVSSAD